MSTEWPEGVADLISLSSEVEGNIVCQHSGQRGWRI